MKKLTLFILLNVITVIQIHPQENDNLIQLSYGIGDTIDLIDREIFGLYPKIEGFQFAQLYERNTKYLISKITFLDNGILLDTVLVQEYHELYNLRHRASKFLTGTNSKFKSPLNSSVFLTSGNEHTGRLEMFSKKYLYLNNKADYLSEEFMPSKFRLHVSRVDSIVIQAPKNNIGSYMGYGLLAGSALGLATGLIWINSADLMISDISALGITTLSGAGIGLLFGWLIGATIPDDIITIRFNSPVDIVKLKDYSAYYYQRNPSIEEQYAEIK